MAGEQAAQRPAYPAGVHAGQVGLGDQGFGTRAEPLVGWQPCAETAAMLFWALLASGQITLRKVDGWQSLAQPPAELDLAA